MLIDIATLQKYQFKIPLNNAEDINYYNGLIESASSIITNYIGMDFTPTSYTEYLDNVKAGKYLVVKRVPLIEVTEILVNGSLYSGEYTFDKTSGIIRFTNPLDTGTDVKISYLAGYDEVPKDIIYATVELVQYLKKRLSNSLVGESSKNIDGGSINIETSIPLNVLHILNRYKWKGICV
jgi:hypothetical protein